MEGSSRTFPAGLDHNDLCRAFACALAVSRRDVFAQYSDAFTLDPERQFQEVYFSPAEDEQQFIVAHAKDAVFFGFMGTKVLADYACDMMIDKITGPSGSYHKGIYHRSSCFLGLLGGKFVLPLLELVEQKKRIIFCGHSLGGAVGHMVLTRLLLEDELRLFRAASKNMLSIAFGAPHFCDKVAAAAIEEFPGRFFTFVNERDPVPRLLHDLPRTIQKVALKVKDGVRSRTRVELLGSLCGSLLHFFATGKVVDLDPSDAPTVCELLCNSWEEMETKASDAKDKGSVYSPIGTFVFLRGQSRFKELNSTSEAIKGLLCDISLDDECFADHRCGSYLRALLDDSLIEAVERGQDARKFYHKATSRQPEVGSAVCEAIEGGGPGGGFVLHITGKNLFLLREVSLNGVRVNATEVVESTLEKLVILHPLSSEESDENKRASRLSLVVKTPFGDCTSSVVQEFHQDDQNRHVGYLLRKLVLVLVLLAKLDVLPPEAELDWLEVILRNFGGMEKPLKTILTATGLEKAEVALGIADLAGSNIEKLFVFEFKKGDMTAKKFAAIEETVAWALSPLTSTLQATSCGAIPGAAFGYPSLAAASAITCGATGAYIVARTSLVCVHNASGWIVSEAIDRLEPIVLALVCKYLVRNYEDLLGVAVEEVRRWNPEPRSSGVNRQSYTEDDLVEQVKCADESFRAMLRGAFSEDRTMLLMLATGYLSSATDECSRQFLRRIYAIVETKNLYDRFVSNECFVAVVGPEDVGKTSFIEEVVPESVPQSEAGIDVHTVEAKPYRLENGLTLVDFPGENGVSGEFDRWFTAFTAMPSIIVLLLNFDHDIKLDQVALYKKFRERIRSRILVVFNKVDKHVEKRTMKKYIEPSYFRNLRKESADKLECPLEHVFYASLSPDEAKVAAVRELMKVGVVDVHGFMQSLRGFRQGTRNSFRL